MTVEFVTTQVENSTVFTEGIEKAELPSQRELRERGLKNTIHPFEHRKGERSTEKKDNTKQGSKNLLI